MNKEKPIQSTPKSWLLIWACCYVCIDSDANSLSSRRRTWCIKDSSFDTAKTLRRRHINSVIDQVLVYTPDRICTYPSDASNVQKDLTLPFSLRPFSPPQRRTLLASQPGRIFSHIRSSSSPGTSVLLLLLFCTWYLWFQPSITDNMEIRTTEAYRLFVPRPGLTCPLNFVSIFHPILPLCVASFSLLRAGQNFNIFVLRWLLVSAFFYLFHVPSSLLFYIYLFAAFLRKACRENSPIPSNFVLKHEYVIPNPPPSFLPRIHFGKILFICVSQRG